MEDRFTAMYKSGDTALITAKTQDDFKIAASIFARASAVGDFWQRLRALRKSLISWGMAGDVTHVTTNQTIIQGLLSGIPASDEKRSFEARVQRDVAAVFIDEIAQLEAEDNFADDLRILARQQLKQSVKTLRELGQIEESAVSLGFIAQLDLVIGNPIAAIKTLWVVDSILRAGNNRSYELDNLLCLLANLRAPVAHPVLLVRTLILMLRTLVGR